MSLVIKDMKVQKGSSSTANSNPRAIIRNTYLNSLIPRPSQLLNVTRKKALFACNIEKLEGPGDEAIKFEPSNGMHLLYKANGYLW